MTTDDPFGTGFIISDEYFGETIDSAMLDQEGYRCGV